MVLNENANDAYKSLQSGEIKRFEDSPKTIADGLRALSICQRTFDYLKQLDGFYTCSEESINYWTSLAYANNKGCEPSAAISMAAAYNWLKENSEQKTILILVSGGNIDLSLYNDLWNRDH